MNSLLAAQVAKIQSEVAQARQDYWNCGGLGYATEKRQNTLLAYIDALEKAIDSAVDDLEAIKTCASDANIQACAEQAQKALCECYDHVAYRARGNGHD